MIMCVIEGITINLLIALQVAVYKALHFQYKGEAPLPTQEDEYIRVHCFTKPGVRL
jgi:hypothetical protein